MNYSRGIFKKMTAVVVLTSSLSFGSTGSQVTLLQKTLNMDPGTRVAVAGLGSPGNETAYFGPATRNAVIKFQNKYAFDILVPAGLSVGNGRVGPYTLKKLNSLIVSGSIVSTNPTNIPNTPVVSQNDPTEPYKVTPVDHVDIYATDNKLNSVQNAVITEINNALAAKRAPQIAAGALITADMTSVLIKTISLQEAMSGTKISISGSGFSPINKVYFGDSYVVKNVKFLTSGGISLNVPPIPAGRYDVVVKSDVGITNSVVFIVKSATSTDPTISSITPDSVSYGQQLTIYGSNFTPTGNDVVTSLQKFTNVSSPDGRSLSVTIAPISLSSVTKLGNANKTIPVVVTVINNNGISQGQPIFKISY